MQVRHLNVYFFFLIMLLVGVTVFFIFQPFLTAIVAAAILSVLFRPTYQALLRISPGRPGSASFLTCLLVGVIIVTPVLSVLSLAIAEANHLYHTIAEERSFISVVEVGVQSIQETSLGQIVFKDSAFTTESIMEDIRQFSQNALGLLQAAYQSVTHFVFWVFVMFFTLFYFLIDGDRAFRRLIQLSPLKTEHETLLAAKFISISRATLKGTMVVGAIQGLLGGLAFWIVGVPSPAIWGLLMILLSIIPLVGSALVWLPAGIILLLLGQVWQGAFILVVGSGVISLIDNILRPKLVGKDTQMHPLMVFFATLGGISLFGLPGFIIGPIIVSLFMALGEIYSIEFKNQLAEYNND
ncbi:MAG: AI-2E family transporter [Candidatus Moraniibacteriota bacterium]